jgi:hypothetical protein
MSMPAILSGSLPLVIDERFEPGYVAPLTRAQTKRSASAWIVPLCLLIILYTAFKYK